MAMGISGRDNGNLDDWSKRVILKLLMLMSPQLKNIKRRKRRSMPARISMTIVSLALPTLPSRCVTTFNNVTLMKATTILVRRVLLRGHEVHRVLQTFHRILHGRANRLYLLLRHLPIQGRRTTSFKNMNSMYNSVTKRRIGIRMMM